MPRILTKANVLIGRAEVISYQCDPQSFYYGELISGTKKYKPKKLQANTIEAAQLEAVDAYSALRLGDTLTVDNNQATLTAVDTSKGVKKTIKGYLSVIHKQVTTNQISQSTYNIAESVMHKTVMRNFERMGISKMSDIKIDTVSNYVMWRQETGDSDGLAW